MNRREVTRDKKREKNQSTRCVAGRASTGTQNKPREPTVREEARNSEEKDPNAARGARRDTRSPNKETIRNKRSMGS